MRISLAASIVASIATLTVSCNTPRADSATRESSLAAGTTATTAQAPGANGPLIAPVEKVEAAEGSEMAPNFTWHDAGGKEHSLKEYRGKVVMINFWATWCPPCRQELPDIVKVRQEMASKGFEVIGISVSEPKAKDADFNQFLGNFASKNGLEYPLLTANDKLITAYGDITAIPTTFIVDRSGKIVQNFVGGQTVETFRKAIQPL